MVMKMMVHTVAPLVGAWIEIIRILDGFSIMQVAPLVGAWIEIMQAIYIYRHYIRRSSRGSVD